MDLAERADRRPGLVTLASPKFLNYINIILLKAPCARTLLATYSVPERTADVVMASLVALLCDGFVYWYVKNWTIWHGLAILTKALPALSNRRGTI
jgi:hypothetical protein